VSVVMTRTISRLVTIVDTLNRAVVKVGQGRSALPFFNISSNYHTDLSLTGKRGKTKSAPKSLKSGGS
jgi:hypothetical protein